MASRTKREMQFKRAVSRAITKSKGTTRALARLLNYDIPRGPQKPRSISIWSSTAGDIVFLLNQIAEGQRPEHWHATSAAKLAKRLEKALRAKEGNR